MTCIAALKYRCPKTKKTHIIVGSESLTTLESTKLVNICNESKIITFPNFTVLVAGDGPVVDALEYIKMDVDGPYDWNYHTINNRQDCIAFVTHFVEMFQERAPETNGEDLKYEFLISDGEKIWWAISGPSVFEIGTFWASGSGSSYAIGYLEAIIDYCDDRGIDPDEISKLVVGSLKEKLEAEAQRNNLLPKSASLFA